MLPPESQENSALLCFCGVFLILFVPQLLQSASGLGSGRRRSGGGSAWPEVRVLPGVEEGRCKSPEGSSSQGGRGHFCTGTSQPYPLEATST